MHETTLLISDLLSSFAVNSETTVLQNGEPLSLNLSTDSVEPDFVVVESDAQPAEAQIVNEIPEPTIQKEEVKKSKQEKGRLFGKMFKKKAEPPADVESVQEKETSKDDQTDSPENPPAVDPQPVSRVFMFIFKV